MTLGGAISLILQRPFPPTLPTLMIGCIAAWDHHHQQTSVAAYPLVAKAAKDRERKVDALALVKMTNAMAPSIQPDSEEISPDGIDR